MLKVEYYGGSETIHTVQVSRDWQEFSYNVDTNKLLHKIQFLVGESDPVYIDDVGLEGTRIESAGMLHIEQHHNIGHFHRKSIIDRLILGDAEDYGIGDFIDRMEKRLALLEK